MRTSSIATQLSAAGKKSPRLAVENISLGGLFVRTNEVLPEGTPVVMELVRPGLKQPVTVTGRVVVNALVPGSPAALAAAAKDRPVGLGIQFDPMLKDVEARLAELIRSLGPSSRSSRTTPVPGTRPVTARVSLAPDAPRPPPVAPLTPPPPAAALAAPTPLPGRGEPPMLLPRLTPTAPVAPGRSQPPPPPPPQQPLPPPTGDAAVLGAQVRSLLLEVGALKSALFKKEQELERLQAENAQLRAQLSAPRR